MRLLPGGIRFGLTCLCVSFPSTASAQDSALVRSGGHAFYNQPNGRRLADLQPGARLALGGRDGDWREVTLEGWIFRPSVELARNGALDLRVTARPTENFRADPGGTVLAKLRTGFLLTRVDDSNPNWVRARRTGWVRREAVAPLEPAPSGPDGVLEVARARRSAAIRTTPGGDSTAGMREDATLRVLERRGGWARVRVEGWVPEDAVSVDDGVMERVTLADLQADPEAFRGKIVRWRVQYVSIGEADELRPDMPRGQPYMLARGPLPETAYLYAVVPTGRVAAIEKLPPLATIVITGRVRTARAKFLNNPVLDLLDFSYEEKP